MKVKTKNKKKLREYFEKWAPNLANQEWRLNNLYLIKNAQGMIVPFRLNAIQRYIYHNKWFLNIFLKARQLGITTFIDIYLLDNVIFNGKDAAIVAHTLPNAKIIFDTKIRFIWDTIPSVIKESINVDSDTKHMLKFRKGDVDSAIYVATSLRGGTLNLLHVSELGTIDQKYPDKAKEIATGALNTIHSGQEVFIESTAKGRFGVFYNICQQAIQNQQSGKKLTSLDYKFFFFPWYVHPEYKLKEKVIIPRRLQDYFNEIEIKAKIKIDEEQRAWYFKKSLTQGEAMQSEFPSLPEEAFAAAIEGAYYSKQMEYLRQRKQISRIPYDASLRVDT